VYLTVLAEMCAHFQLETDVIVGLQCGMV